MGVRIKGVELVIEFFPDIKQSKNFFFSTMRHERFFFQCRNLFSSGISFQEFFFARNHSAEFFFPEITNTPPPPPQAID